MADKKPRVVGVLGGGQLGRMLLEAANRLNVQVNVLDADNAPAKQISNHSGHVNGSFKDQQSIQELARTSDVLTVEIEHVDTEKLENVSSQVPVEPSWSTLRTIQDKYAQHRLLKDAGIAVAPFEEVPQTTADELTRIAERLGYPFMLKAKRDAYDGRGNFPVKSKGEIPAALEALDAKPLYAEAWADFKMELAVMVVKTATGTMSFPTVETIHEDSICKLVYAPARNVSAATSARAQALARQAVAQFKGKGVFGVEMFLLRDDRLLINEIAPRPHNSGHYTIESCPLSQYDAHLRAILDKPIPVVSLAQEKPAIMLNILGGAAPDSHLELARLAETIPRARIHLYGKGDARPGRKMGHITLTAPTMREAEANIRPLISAADKLRASRVQGATAPPAATYAPKAAPLVGVVTGSISDQPVLEGCYKVLEQLGVSYEKRITSAHRTPDLMAEYSRTAKARGIKVVIAAAGGAAHLPGMVAAFSEGLPVIGVPIKPTIGDGMDSVLSILNMPNGVPVATVGVNKAANAALLAARIIGSWDNGISDAVVRYTNDAAEESLANDRKLQE